MIYKVGYLYFENIMFHKVKYLKTPTKSIYSNDYNFSDIFETLCLKNICSFYLFEFLFVGGRAGRPSLDST